MKLLSNSNTKLAKDGIWSFGLPAAKTCPGAGACKKICYADKGCYMYPIVAKAQKDRLDATKHKTFVGLILTELWKKRKAPINAVRIHDSGDFYNQEYLDKWIEIAAMAPEVLFYAYTKSLHLDFANRPKNLLIIASYGSIYDEHIEQIYTVGFVDSTAKIFPSKDMIPAYYGDSSESDLVAIKLAKRHFPIALIKH